MIQQILYALLCILKEGDVHHLAVHYVDTDTGYSAFFNENFCFWQYIHTVFLCCKNHRSNGDSVLNGTLLDFVSLHPVFGYLQENRTISFVYLGFLARKRIKIKENSS